MISRDNLVQAIYDNVDEWSCEYSCPHITEEAKECSCYTCAEQKLKEYEDSIRRQAIKDFSAWFSEVLKIDECLREYTEQRWIEDFEKWCE